MTRWSQLLLAALTGCAGDKAGTDSGMGTDTDTDADADADSDGDADADGDGDGDGDGDSDSDSDGDGDGDGDSDSDTDPGTSPVTGSWLGRCDPSPTDTGNEYGILGVELQFDLTDAGGSVSGTGLLGIQELTTDGIDLDTSDTDYGTTITTTYTYTYPFPVDTQGNWDGTELVLVFAATTYTLPLPMELTASIASDVMAGTFAVYPSGTSGYQTVSFDCVLDRL